MALQTIAVTTSTLLRGGCSNRDNFGRHLFNFMGEGFIALGVNRRTYGIIEIFDEAHFLFVC